MVPRSASAILIPWARAALACALVLSGTSAAAPAADGEAGHAAPPPRAPIARAWFEVPLPSDTAALARAAGLDPATEPWRLLPDLTRRLHAPYGERVGPRVTAQIVAALGGPAPATPPATASLAAVPIPLPSVEGEGTATALLVPAGPVATAETPVDGELVPVPLTRESWRRILGNDRRTGHPRDVFAALATDHRAARLFRGLLALDGGTLEFLAREPGLLRDVLQRQASAFSVFAASFRVDGGRVAVPGGHEAAALWQEMVGASVLKPQEFLLRLGSGQGHLFSFYDAVDRLDDAHRRFALAAAEPDPRRRLERVRALRAVFARAEPWWTDTRPPYSRPPADAARVLAAARVAPSGALAEPSAEALWAAAFDDQAEESPQWPARLAQSPPADAAWLSERIAAVEPSLGRGRLAMLAFGQRVFGASGETGGDPGVLLLALRGFGRHRALALTLERMGLRDPGLHAAAERQAERLDEAGHGEHARSSLAQFQGALTLVERVWDAGTIDSAAAAERVRGLVAVPLEDGRYGDGVARWIEGELLPALRLRTGAPASASAETVLLRAMAGVGTAGALPRLQWEGLAYDVDPAAAEYQRLRRMRQRQAAGTLDDALLAPSAEREARLAAVLVDLAYAAALGSVEGAPAAIEDVARRHDFAFEEAAPPGGPRPGWAMPREMAGPGLRWHVRGALLGLDLGLARLVLHRLDTDVPPMPTLTAADHGTFAEGVVLLRPATLDEAGRDAIRDALRLGRARIQEAAADPAALARLVADLRLRDWRRGSVAWLAAREPDRLEAAFTLGEVAALGTAGGASLPESWGTSARAEDGCLCSRLALGAHGDELAGRSGDGRRAALAPDLHLRVAELLAEMDLPARLAPAVLAMAVEDLADRGAPAYVDDPLAVARFARSLTRTRMEDYVAALAGNGPLRPVAAP